MMTFVPACKCVKSTTRERASIFASDRPYLRKSNMIFLIINDDPQPFYYLFIYFSDFKAIPYHMISLSCFPFKKSLLLKFPSEV